MSLNHLPWFCLAFPCLSSSALIQWAYNYEAKGGDNGKADWTLPPREDGHFKMIFTFRIKNTLSPGPLYTTLEFIYIFRKSLNMFFT